MSARISTLLSWCRTQGIQIDDRIVLRESPTSGLTVYAADEIIPSNTSLVRIPRSSVLSVKSSSLCQFIDVPPYGHEAQLALALVLYAEILKSERSHWYGYLQSLPLHTVDIAALWGHDRDHDPIGSKRDLPDDDQGRALEDLRTARAWIPGTDLERELEAQPSEDGTEEEGVDEIRGQTILESVRNYYFRVVEPLLSWQPILQLRDFFRAYSLVSSRAFLVDAYYGLSMVPIADVFNHAQDHQVHLESDYDVCVICGSFEECAHDTSESGPLESDPTGVIYEMVSNATILPCAQIFNTYGTTLTNAQLLARYGFILEDGNMNDGVGWQLSDLRRFAVWRCARLQAAHNDGGGGKCYGPKDHDHGVDRVINIWRELLRSDLHDSLERFGKMSDLVCGGNTEETSIGKQAHMTPDERNGRIVLRLNGDAKITTGLWLFCALLSLDFDSAPQGGQGRCIGGGDCEAAPLSLIRHGADVRALAGPPSVSWICSFLRDVADLQTTFEREAWGEVEKEGSGAVFCTSVSGESRDRHQYGAEPYGSMSKVMLDRPMKTIPRGTSIPAVHLLCIIQTVLSLCDFKGSLVGREFEQEAPVTMEEVGEYVDGLPAHMTKTRLVMTEVMSEWSILQSCHSRWEELLTIANKALI